MTICLLSLSASTHNSPASELHSSLTWLHSPVILHHSLLILTPTSPCFTHPFPLHKLLYLSTLSLVGGSRPETSSIPFPVQVLLNLLSSSCSLILLQPASLPLSIVLTSSLIYITNVPPFTSFLPFLNTLSAQYGEDRKFIRQNVLSRKRQLLLFLVGTVTGRER